MTEIREVTKKRDRVYLDGKSAFVLYKGELSSYGIKEGEELDPQIYVQLVEKVLPKRAGKRAMLLLEKRDYTEKQLHDKLSQGGYPERVIEEALSYVRSFHYLDDRRYAAQYVACHMQERSRGRILQDLLRKGIAKEKIEQAFAEAEELGAFSDEADKARKLLEKKKYPLEGLQGPEKQKMMAKACSFLAGKGFRFDMIYEVVQDFFTST